MIPSTMASLGFLFIRILPVIVTIIFTSIPSQVHAQGEGVRLSLKGASIANNSYVDVDDIGEGDDALLCHTNNTGCCSNSNLVREWYYPNGEKVGIEIILEITKPTEFYRNRGNQVVRLNYRNGSFTGRGRFRCEIPDKDGVSQNLYVAIGPPLIEPAIKNITLGNDVTFTLVLSANFGSAFQWQHNSRNIINEMMSTLTIMNVMKTDGGNYSCIVTLSLGGSITSKMARLLIFSPATISIHPSNTIVAQGGEANFSVMARGDGLTYQWQRNGMNIENNDGKFEGVFKDVLTVKGVQAEDAGKYKCIVFNGAEDNATSNEATLTVVSPPSITHFLFEANAITIYWQQDNTVEYYELQYNFTIKQCATEMGTQIKNITAKGNYTIRNGTDTRVEEDSNYNISLIAISSGVRSPATIIMNTTKEAAPDGVPMSIASASVTSTSITITWKRVACYQRNGEIDGYNVTYYREGFDTDKITATVLGVMESNRTFLACRLQPRTNYTFEVQAFNGDKIGPAANDTFQTSISDDVNFFLNGELLPNNSLVNHEDIDEANKALFCLTNSTACCKNTSQGGWYSPGNMLIMPKTEVNESTGFYTKGGPSIIGLNKPKDFNLSSGVFHCKIIDADGNEQRIYVGIYSSDTGLPDSVNLTFIKPTLTCTSAGGPATSVIWKKNQTEFNIDGTVYKQNQIITDTQNAEYRTMLTLPMTSIEAFDSSYECIVKNTKGSRNANLKLEGLSISPNKNALVIGESADINCTSTIEVEQLLWLDQNDTVLVSSSSNTIAILAFNPVDDSIHNKTFTCKAVQMGTVERNINIMVSVYFVTTAPSGTIIDAMIDHPLNNPRVGELYNLTCLYNISKGFTQTPAVLWKHPNGNTSSNSSVVFDTLLASHNGQYTCEVTVISPALDPDMPKIAVDTYNLTIQLSSPDLSISVPNSTLYAGSTINITCSVTLVMEIDIDAILNVIWFKGSTANLSNVASISPSSNPFTSVLTIYPLSATDNNITCSAKIFPTNETSLFLIESPIQSVSYTLMVENPTIDVTIVPSNADIQTVGNKLNITCSISGYEDVNPIFAFQWTNDNDDSINLTSDQTLSFPSLNLSDAGKYTCKVNISSNYFVGGHVTGMESYSVMIKVPKPSSVTVTSSPQMIYVGSNFTLHCNITLSVEIKTATSIKVSVDWTGPVDVGVMVSEVQKVDENPLQYSTTLLLNSVNSSHAGNYMCQARVATSNSAYLATSSPESNTTEISIISAPSAPGIESLQPLNSTSVEIIVTKGSKIDIVENIIVEYMYNGPCDCSDQILELCQWREITDNEFNITISNLQEHSNYTFKVVANNQAGSSPPTTMTGFTLSAAPTGVPLYFNISRSTLTTITVQWSSVQCTEQNSVITGYVIQLNESETIDTGSVQEFVVPGLYPSTTYTIRIAAVGNNVSGPFSSSIPGSTLSPKNVSFLLNGQFLPNSSAVIWMKIGKGSAALFCLTNNTSCCDSTSPMQYWNFPNETKVHLINTDVVHQEYRNNSILLQHQVGTQSTANGIFKCQIRDDSGQLKHLYIGIYQDRVITAESSNLSISFDLINDLNISFIMTCTSVGGPISQMLWLHNGTIVPNSNPFPKLGDAENGLYYSTLHIHKRGVGVYSCMIMDGFNFSLTKNHTVQELRMPSSVHAVWTNVNKTFHMCWAYQDQESSPSAYRIMNSSYANLSLISHDSSKLSYNTSINIYRNVDFVFIQALSMTSLPSKPFSVSISDPGVSLTHRGMDLHNGSVLSIESIGEGAQLAIICKTEREDCCRYPKSLAGEWYYPNGSKVPISSINQQFYRTRTNKSEVLLHRRNQSLNHTTGVYCCRVFDKNDNCGINQTLCVNLASLATITSPDQYIAGEVYILQCTAVIGSETTSIPSIMWLGPNGRTIDPISLPPGIILKATNTSGAYIHTLKFNPLQEMHGGKYECVVLFKGTTESSSTNVKVLQPTINVEVSGKEVPTAGQNYCLMCNVTGANNLMPTITYKWIKDNGTQTLIEINSSTLLFSHLRLSDAGLFTCIISISSPYLDVNISSNNTMRVEIKVPDPVRVQVVGIEPQGEPLFLPSWMNTSVNLTCSVVMNNNIVDVPVTIETTWTGSERFSITNTAKNVIKNYSSTVTVGSLHIGKAGVYRCLAVVKPGPAKEFIIGNGTSNDSTSIALYSITVEKKETNISYEIGSFATLQCTVNARGINESARIAWTHNGNTIQNSTGLTNLLLLHSLRASQVGQYFCHASFASVTGNESIIISATLDLELALVLNSSSNPVTAGDSVNIICGARINKTLVDIDVNVDVHLMSLTINATEREDDARLGLYQRSIHFDSISAQDSGIFMCNITVRSLIMSEFVQPAYKYQTFDLILVPSSPIINSTKVLKDSINIQWSQTPGDRIDYYLIDHSYQDRCSHSFQPKIINQTKRKVDLGGLEEYSNYRISITAVNSQGQRSMIQMIVTLSSAPSGEPQNISGNALNSTSINIEWNALKCLEQNGDITNYTIHYQPMDPDYQQIQFSVIATTSKTMKSFTAIHLLPRTMYVFSVSALNVNGSGPNGTIVRATAAVRGVQLFHGGYFYANNSIVTMDEIGEGGLALLCLTEKQDCCRGLIRVGAWFFPSGTMVDVKDAGDFYRNRGPGVVRLNRRNNASLPSGIFHCEIPDEHEELQSIYVGIYPVRSGIPRVEEFNFDANQQVLMCTSISGPATNVIWRRNEIRLRMDDEVSYVQTQAITDKTESRYLSRLYIRKPEPTDVAGNYSCTVSNLRGNDSQNLEIKGLRVTGHELAVPHGSPAALNCTTDLAVNTIQWLDTRGNILKNATNSPLELTIVPSDHGSLTFTCRIKSDFGIQLKNVTLTIQSEATPVISSAVPAIIVVLMLAILILAVIAASLLIVRRKRQGKLIFPQRVKSKLHRTFVVHATPLHAVDQDDVVDQGDDVKLKMTTFGKHVSVKVQGSGATVPVGTFDAHVKKMHDDRDKLFEDEYSSISKEPQKSHDVAEIFVNKMRNRFGNIFPYDHCRVKLKEIAGCEHSDYINASYLDGYQKPSAYIAAQGPLPNTLEDFWRMIWENRLTTIVMLTQCFEGRKKCECYWPENINCTFEPGQGIQVVLTSMVPFTEYIIRKMTVTRSTESQLPPLDVIQFHFVAWPDHGVPDNCAVMLNFIRRVRKLHPYTNPCPLLVHCSAGVGRTGTFIVLDTMIERMKIEDTLNIYDYVKHIREQRVLMVQSLAQYVFIHDALKEYLLCGQTEIPATHIRKVIDELSVQHDPCSASTGFQHHFQILGQLPYMTEDKCYSNATSEENIWKNRYSNKLPNNFYRVRLKSTATPGSDYINASFIDGYRQKNTYIAAQGPLESTVCDFWRMVWEKQSKCVVLLCQLKENDKEECSCYWPADEGDTKTYGKIAVKLLTEEHYGYCDLRKFEINEDKTSHPGVEGVKTGFTVTQFHFLEWPEHETPPITSSLIELMGNVNKVQMGSGNKPLIVMCNDGMGRTGTFICIHAQLERLKTEGVFDIFQFIKSARIQRAGLVSDSVQYVLCHEVLADYVESFDTYANFKEVMNM